MNSELIKPISSDEIEQFREDGVVCIRGQIDQDWVNRMHAACLRHAADPSEHLLKRCGTGSPSPMAKTSFMALTTDDFASFMRNSPLPAIAGSLMGVDTVRYWYDQLFIKDPKSGGVSADLSDLRRARTFWHNDMPFWPLRGSDIVSVWVALTDVGPGESGLEYVAGSHKAGRMYRPYFDRQDEGVADLDPCPNYDELRHDPEVRILSWEMAAGDCLVHHPLTVHGSSDNSSLKQRVALSTRYIGRDVSYHPTPVPWFTTPPKVAPGGFPDDPDHFPVVWQRAAAAH